MNDIIKNFINCFFGGGNKPLDCRFNVSLAERTWIHRGGIVKYWWLPNSYAELVAIDRFL